MTAPPNSMEIQFPVPERTSPFRRGAHLQASRALPSVYNGVCRLRVAVVHSPARAFARLLAGPTQLAIERGGVAFQDHLRDVPDRGALVHKSATQRNLHRRQLRRGAQTPAPRPQSPPASAPAAPRGPPPAPSPQPAPNWSAGG